MESINIGRVPRDARDTRRALIRAGERLFARQGVDGARTADIRRAAGQQNESALHYHFGSRDGLLVAILRKHLEATEPERGRALAAADGDGGASLPGLVAALVLPDAACLHREDGRDYLRIIAQIAGSAGIQQGPVRLPVTGSALERVLDLLVRETSARVPEPVARERVATVIGFLTFALADRARRIEADDPALPRHEAFTADLTAMLVAALCAAPAADPP
jgi:AcrR family transcriptional regulator